MARIDVSKIPGFAEMSAEDKLNALIGYEFETPAPAASSEREEKLKKSLDNAMSEAANYKKQLREKQTEQEKADAERKEAEDKMKARLAELERSSSVNEHIAQFAGIGYGSDLARTSAEALVDGDFATVFGNLKAFVETHDKEVKASVLKNTPAPVSGGTQGGMVSKKQFDSMTYKERAQLAVDNPELYSELNNM